MATYSNPVTVVNYEPVEFVIDDRKVPLVVGISNDGALQMAVDLISRGRTDPAQCGHPEACWSDTFTFCCPDCGATMFLPPKLLKYLPAATISDMDMLWSAAGWPRWHGLGWVIDPKFWTLEQQPLFDHCGGLPVRNDRRMQYDDALDDLAKDAVV